MTTVVIRLVLADCDQSGSAPKLAGNTIVNEVSRALIGGTMPLSAIAHRLGEVGLAIRSIAIDEDS